MILASLTIGPVQFDKPSWLWLALVCAALTIWWGRASLSGLGTVSRRVALIVRLIVIALLVGTLARPQWRREAENVTVSVVLDQSKSVPDAQQRTALDFLKEAAAAAKPGDLMARVTVGREAYVQSLPGPPRDEPATEVTVARDATNLEEGARLSMAVMPAGTANRLLIISDGLETSGKLLEAAAAAVAAKIPVDVLPLRFRYENEVKIERLSVPATARMGQNVNLRALLDATKGAKGRMTVLVNGTAVDLDPAGDSLSMAVELQPGPNPVSVPITLPLAGPQRFEVYFEPDLDPSGKPIGDAIAENNRALGVTFVQSEGRVLVLAPDPAEVSALVQALTEARIQAEYAAPSAAPQSLLELAAYDCVVLANTAVYEFSQQQQDDLRAYVHDGGGGLVMVGGPDAFGAGGWIGSPVADALPIKLDPPQKRQMPRGALGLIMHSCEMPQGNYWGKQVCIAAVNALSRLDLATVVEHNWQKGGADVLFPIAPVGNKAGIMRAINSFSYGDAPDFDALMLAIIPDLEKASAGAKHAIVVSDGDPSPPSAATLQRYKNARVSVTCVLVYPHSGFGTGPEATTMRRIATETNGRFYPVVDEGGLANLPRIIVKEAQTVKRALIWEGQAFAPVIINSLAEPMRGIGTLPPIGGYVVAGEREGLALVTARGKEEDPVLAMWQYGLGKTVAFTSDGGSRWAKGWGSWANYKAFWEQHIRWAMRPGGSADMRVVTEDLGDRTKVVVEALDPKGEPLNFVRWNTRFIGPEGSSGSVDLRQVGPGRYEGEFDSQVAGSYVFNARYIAPSEEAVGGSKEGNIQAAVTRPFADEFRALEDNAALLRMVAQQTGGRVINTDPRRADLWSREGLKMPVATRPIWLTVAILAIGLFLMDVGVRRVRIDIPAMVRSVRRGMSKSRQEAGRHLGGLKEARQAAQQTMAERVKAGDRKGAEAVKAAMKADEATAKAKFEVGADELAKSKANVGMASMEPDPGAARPRQVKGAVDAAEGMSRLLKAKQRARGEMEDEQEDGKK